MASVTGDRFMGPGDGKAGLEVVEFGRLLVRSHGF
jgi:hypothetical protein